MTRILPKGPMTAFLKNQPAVADVHGATALGNSERKPKKPFKPVLVDGQTNKRALQPLDGATAKTPFPYDSGALGRLRPDQVPRFLGAITDPDRLPVQDVMLDNLVAVQNRVDPKKVAALQGARQAGGSIKHPVVVQAGGKLLIGDGHHRLAADWLDGKATAPAHFLDLDPYNNSLKRGAAGGGEWHLPFKVSKSVPDKRQIFGWASIATIKGKLVTDYQDDRIRPEVLEKAAYDFVLFHRNQGHMHDITGVGRMIESMMFTTEKQQVLGIDLGKEGWWLGFQVDHDPTWEAIKRGDLPEFSIGGRAIRVEVED